MPARSAAALAIPGHGESLDQSLRRIGASRVLVFGDLCLDAYWEIDARGKERSIETGLPVQAVASQRYSLGGAANVAANAKALGAAWVGVVGAIGDDGFGWELRRLLAAHGIDSGNVVDGGADWNTQVYAKPLLESVELPRLDFGSRLTPEVTARLLAQLEAAVGGADAVVINQQVRSGLEDGAMVGRLDEVIAAHPRVVFVVDARDSGGSFRNAVLKLNAAEAARQVDGIAVGGTIPLEQTHRHATVLAGRTARPVFVTRGERGMVVAHGEVVIDVPGIQVSSAIDPVGAGDTVAAAIAAALGGGCLPEAAARIANVAASITVRKLRTTGTATPAEIRQVGETPDHVWFPDIADDARFATCIPGSSIEIVRALAPGRPIRHAIFDHDGTLSTLRQGWEAVMEPMMVRAILGERLATADARLIARAGDEVRTFIDRTTGIQTLVQMQGLVELVREFGCVPRERILDHIDYKALYNDALMAMVRDRARRLANGELGSEDFQIKNARRLLERLRAAGVVLHLASGTDQRDLSAEAEAMGYAHLFDGIHGAVGDVAIEAKRDVMDRILRLHGDAGFVVFGDGPVEIREGRRRGAVCVGVASDELRRFGVDAAKRRRLIRAGADVIVGDYSQLDILLRHIGIT